MAMETHRGAIWPDAVGTATDPTAAYAVNGPAFVVKTETELTMRVTVAGAACRAIGLEVQAYDGAAWRAVARKVIVGGAIGVHVATFSLPQWSSCRLTARRWGGSATTTFVVEADSRVFLGASNLDGQPVELAIHQEDGIECWGDGAGAAAAMAAGPGAHAPAPSAAASQLWIPTGEADTLVVDFTVAVAAPTTVELEVREQHVGSTDAVEKVAINSVLAGVTSQQIAQEQIVFGALDVRRTREISVRPGTEILILAQYTGGAGGTTGYGVARLYRLGR